MRFKKLISDNQRKLEETDKKLIRAIEDVIEIGGYTDKMPTVVQELIKERKALRTSGGETDGKI